MMKGLSTILLLWLLNTGCVTQESASEQMTVRGYLEHFPMNVRSSQAWHGHHFRVGNTPIIPTEQVPKEVLQKLVGALVVVTGVWHTGERWNHTKEELNMPRPVYPKILS
jgi:hypothetical protein